MSEQTFSDEQASRLLHLLTEYFEAYPNDGSPSELTAEDIAKDLLDGFPWETRQAAFPACEILVGRA